MNKEELRRALLQYGFHDEQGNYTVVLNKLFLEELFDCDQILFEEREHR